MRNMKRPLSKFRKLVMVTKICAAWLCERKTPRSMLTGSRLQVRPKTRKSLQYSSWTVCTKCFSQHKQTNACFLLNTLVALGVSKSQFPTCVVSRFAGFVYDIKDVRYHLPVPKWKRGPGIKILEISISHHLFLKISRGLTLVSDDAVSLGRKYPANNDDEEEDVEKNNAG